MKHSILLALILCLFATAQSQKTKVTPAKTETKTFIVSAATAKDLPEGVTFSNNKILLKNGYKFEQLPNNGGVNLINTKNNLKEISGTFNCYCSNGNGTACKLTTLPNGVYCEGGVCCTISTTINSIMLPPTKLTQN